jgi:glycosyltransferase involved in cell wall biosynthesis
MYNYSMSSETLSVCMIAKNEEKYLANCLGSISSKVDEIILVDTGSIDSTIQIAEKFPVKIFNLPWPDDFSIARNFSIKQATSSWILVLDADETIDHDQFIKLKKYLATTIADGISITIRNFLPPDELIPFRDHTTVRIFRNNPHFFFEGKVHESVQPSIFREMGTIAELDCIINHFGYIQMQVQGSALRGERNLKLIIEMLSDHPDDAYFNYQAGITYKHLKHYKQARFHLRKALSANLDTLPKSVLDEILMKLAQIASLEKQDQECIKYAAASLKHNPENLISKYLLALSYVSIGKIAKAYPYLLEIQNSRQITLTNQNDLNTLITYCKQILHK